MRDAGVFGSDPSLWESVGKPLSLPVGEVHVWQADLDRPGLPLPTLAALLSPEECTRAARFLRDSHRDRFVAARGILRLLLGRYTASPPESLRFVLGPNGKPELASDCNPDALHFNRTDSSALALYAFSRERRIGIDVE
jgi:4'-phosphopantetheinyl transferase